MVMIRCTACGYQIPGEAFRSAESVACPLCHRHVEAVVLPAIVRGWTMPPTLPPEAPGPGEAACFYNPERKATDTCSHCGVFMCAAWTARWGSMTVCLKCLDELRNRRKDPRFESRRVLWSNIAFGTALVPFALCLPLTPFLLLHPVGLVLTSFVMILTAITGPTALGLTIATWKKPRGMVPRGRWIQVVTLVISFVQCVAWTLLIVLILTQRLNLAD
jgi:hypothetical protein